MRKKGLWKKSASVLIVAAMLMTSVPVYAAEPDEQVEEVVVQEQTEDAEKEVEEIRLEDESAGAENDGEEKVVVEETTEEDDEELCVGAGAVQVYVNGRYQNNQTLENAINNANSNSTIDIQLLDDVEVNDTIWINTEKKVTLDLNGHNIVFKGESINGENRLFVQYGTLDVTGSGTLREKTASYAPIIVRGNTNNSPNWTTVNIGKNVTLEGWSGVFVSAPNVNCADGVVVNIDGKIQGRAATDDPGCGVYVNGAINRISGNVPRITLGPTSSITSPGDGIYAAGHANWTLQGDITAATALSIKSGIFDISSGTYHSTGAFVDTPVTDNSGPEDTGAALNITSNDGYAQETDVTIKGGTFISDNGYAVYEGIAKSGNTPAAGASYATLSIKGGFFKGNNVRGTVSLNEMANRNRAVISGGYFNVPFTSDYIVKDDRGLELLVNQDSYQNEYGYVVGVRKPTEVEPAVGEPEVDLKGSSISEKKQEDVKKAAENVEATGLGSCANEVASDVTQNEANEAKIQGKKELDKAQIPHAGDNITIYAQTYLDIKPKEFTDTITDDKTPIYSLDIEPKYYLVASTAKTSEDIRLKDEGDKKKNAAKIPNSGGSVDTTNRVVKLDIPLPEGFIKEPAPKTLFVKHVKKNGKTYYYYADVKATTVNGKITYSVSFTNDKGFSTFTILAEGTVAEVGGVGYTSLDAALKAATSGDTVYLLKDVTENEIIAAGKNITLDLNGNTINGSVENKGTVTITGNGKITGNISSSGTTSIQSGTFAGTLTTNGNGKFSISGGTFKPGTVKTEYCAPGYEPNANGSGVSAIYSPVQPSSENNNLSSLTLSKGTLTPAFDKDTTSYTATVDETVDSITVTPVSEDSLASIQVNGKTVASGKASEAIALKEGENIITVVVTAQNGEQKTYTIKVTRSKAEPGSNADLAGLALSKGTLSPKFSAEKEQYKAVVENVVDSILVTPKAADENSTVTVNGKPSSEKVALKVGYNTIKVKVVSADGKATKTYTIQVTRVVPKNKTITISRRKYKVTNELIAKASVAITGLSDNKVINLSVPDTIQIYGVTYKVTSIGTNAFRKQPKMKTAKIGNNVTTIGYGAFYACPILNSVTVGKSVKTIGNHAFCRDTKLRTLTFQGTALTKLGDHLLYQVTNLTIKAPSSKVKAYKKLFTNKGSKSFKVVKK